MASLQGVLANIPGLGGYAAGGEESRIQQSAQLAQMGALQQIAAKAREQGMLNQFRAELQALGPEATQEQLAQVSAKYAGPGDILKSQTSALDRAEMRKQRLIELEMNGERDIQRIREAAAEKRISQQEADAREARMRENLVRLTAQLRPPRAEPAPSFTEVVDPADPSRMLRVDGKVYRGGSMGAAGVLGVSGKEPGAAKRSEKEDQGRDHLSTEIGNLREYFKVLNDSKAIPSSDRGGLSNAASWVQSSAAGQLGGRVFGTKEQDARNQIQSSRLRLLNAIKNATGMSAQQLNSNVELQTWLTSLTDTTRSYESNIKILDDIERSFAKGGAAAAPKPPANPGGGGPKRITSDAEYDALPSGTVFIDPDGKERKKP
jgi:hypothetical protein